MILVYVCRFDSSGVMVVVVWRGEGLPPLGDNTCVAPSARHGGGMLAAYTVWKSE